jgi:hypothetical protein
MTKQDWTKLTVKQAREELYQMYRDASQPILPQMAQPESTFDKIRNLAREKKINGSNL